MQETVKSTKRRSAPSPVASEFEIVVTPGGRVRIDATASPPSGDDGSHRSRTRARTTGGDAWKRIAEAFARGSGHGILQLGSCELDTHLPPSFAFFRDLGRAFVTRLCAVSDADSAPAKISVPVPEEELARLVLAVPPMRGGEYVTADGLVRLFGETEDALRIELAEFGGTLEEFLQSQSPVWNLVGRVHFHLAEHKRDSPAPFAFLATYTTRPGANGKPKHLPLGRAVVEYAGGPGAKKQPDRGALLKLLRPVHAASEKSAFLRELVESGRVFHPLSWSAEDAYRFLCDVPSFEASGVIVTVPDWWRRRGARRPLVQVTVGGGKPQGVGLHALLDFSIDVALDGETLTKKELREILASTDGLALVRGRWIEVDRDKLREVLAHWEAVREQTREGGLSLADGLRLLAGGNTGDGLESPDAELESWSLRMAGPWLDERLRELRDPGALRDGVPAELESILRPYQRAGVRWLSTLGELGLGGCLADDMGLGKTLQVLALLLGWKRRGRAGASLLVAPASLLANWVAEVDRFAPELRVLVAHPSERSGADLRKLDRKSFSLVDLVVTSYGFLGRLGALEKHPWNAVILDEAQAIKNPGAKQTRAVKALESRVRFALTGTPVENRLGDLWSIFDFINPGLLGSRTSFGKLVKRLESRETERYRPLRELTRPYILRRLKTDRAVIADLPDKTEVVAYCTLTKKQAALYQEAVEALVETLDSSTGMARRGGILAYLSRFKQILNHPSQWLGEGDWELDESGKLIRLREICREIDERQEKVLVFTQYREATGPLADCLSRVFGREGLVLHGGTPVGKRRKLVERFQTDEAVPFFVISLRAGGTGLNLTAASHVVHFDRWWNPAVEDQATDRAFRIGQKRNVLVHKFVCRGTVEEKVEAMLRDKRSLSRDVLDSGGEVPLTELDDKELLELVRLDIDAVAAT